MKWYRNQARDLPWRLTRDPYRVIVSEFMLQQTQVSRVEQYYPRFLARYPTLEALSRAPASAVREAWDGLGYYRRAENLHRLARVVVDEHRGTIPADPATLVTLPGVGAYTAGAVASFAYERREAAVDTNVARVLRRVFFKGVKREEGRGKSTNRTKEIWALAETLLPRKGRTVWEFNQALMDLGATVCIARKPKCQMCPVQSACRTGKQR
ncbi:MAG: A/G-specific adenine glycosylase [Gemmatimonadetes bacterium]|nr:A/G-specific adenine glycosylase [Gemmatimonadota bacterium]